MPEATEFTCSIEALVDHPLLQQIPAGVRQPYPAPRSLQEMHRLPVAFATSFEALAGSGIWDIFSGRRSWLHCTSHESYVGLGVCGGQ